MFNISNYLEKFKNILGSEEILRSYVCDSVFKNLSVKIDPKNIEIKNGVAYIKAKPAVKCEIFIKKGAILSEIATCTGKKNIIDLR
jgi:hypothetical protein